MDKEQEEMQFLGFFGVYKQSYNVIRSYWKLFTKLTLTVILPLTFIYLAQIEVSDLIFRDIMINEWHRHNAPVGSARYTKLSDIITTELTYLILFKIAYFTVYVILSLLSTAAVVYTVACIFTARELSFGKVMSVVPKVWKRLLITFLCIFLATLAYTIAEFLIVAFIAFTLGDTAAAAPLVFITVIVYLVGLIYLTVVWNLACVVSVLEESYGAQAMIKSRKLIQGKFFIFMAILVTLGFSILAVQFAFQRLVVAGFERSEHGWRSVKMVDRICYAILCFLVLSMLKLFGLVIQTVIYFVCKSYHHENIDKMALSNHLEVYLLGEYVPLKAKDVQLGEYEV